MKTGITVSLSAVAAGPLCWPPSRSCASAALTHVVRRNLVRKFQSAGHYTQRDGGAWGDSDLAKKDMVSQSGKKITKKPWSNTDKEYAEGGYEKELRASLFPVGPMQWTPKKPPGGPTSNKQNIEVQKKLRARPHTKASSSEEEPLGEGHSRTETERRQTREAAQARREP